MKKFISIARISAVLWVLSVTNNTSAADYQINNPKLNVSGSDVNLSFELANASTVTDVKIFLFFLKKVLYASKYRV